MDAEVYWDGRLVGHLRDVMIDQPYYHGNWSPSGDTGFERAYRALQAEIAPDGLGVLPVTFRSPDGTVSAPAAAMVRPAPESEPYFRFGHEGLSAGIFHRPTCEPEPRNCERCGRPISPHRLQSGPTASLCWDCQTEVERGSGSRSSG
jgi:hypothetical protein